MELTNVTDGQNFPFNLNENEFIFIPPGLIRIFKDTWSDHPNLYIENLEGFGITAYDDEDLAIMQAYTNWKLYSYSTIK
jgi:hypothetical protein